MKRSKKYIAPVVFVALCLFLAIFQTEKINLAAADLGRHIENGKILLFGNLTEKNAILHTNFYSYTEPRFNFINHHWGSGIIFCLIYLVFGFVGLSWFYLLANFAAFGIFFFSAFKKTNLLVASCTAILLMPLMAARTEIRPEVFSYFFSGLVFFWLRKLKNNQLSFIKTLLLVSATQLLWINIHIGFVFGFFLTGTFFIESVIGYFQKNNPLENIKQFFIIGFVSVSVSLLNPNFIKGVLIPLNIFKKYGYKLVENQSIFFLQDYGMENSNFLLVKIVSILLFGGFIILFLKNRKNFLWSDFVIGTVFMILSWQALRNFPYFGLFALPIISGVYYKIFKRDIEKPFDPTILVLGIIFLIIFTLALSSKNLSTHFQKEGFGLMENSQSAADFFKENNLSGPIFNNYDIGGYLIFNLYPEEKVFVDNRPEAYSYDFLQKEYISMQEDNEKWQAALDKYDFNAIFFYRRDITPWAQNFLINRVRDEDWVPVYVDDFNIIFLRNSPKNQDIIQSHRLPKEMFSVE